MNHLLLLAALLVQDPVFPDKDPSPSIEAAKAKAAAENRHVLVLWGSNDDDASKAAAALLKKDKGVARLILYEYDLVFADAAKADPVTQAVISGTKIPMLSVLSPDGKVNRHWKAPADATSMTKFLKENQPEPLKAKDVLAAALKRAGEEKKRVLLTFGAPW